VQPVTWRKLLGLAGVLLAALWMAWYFRPPDASVKAEAVSPDGKYRAVAVLDMGGGAVGWCRVCVHVLPASRPVSAPNLGCRAEQVKLICQSKTWLAWSSVRALEVSYVGALSDPQRHTERPSGAEGVEVSYVWEPQREQPGV